MKSYRVKVRLLKEYSAWADVNADTDNQARELACMEARSGGLDDLMVLEDSCADVAAESVELLEDIGELNVTVGRESASHSDAGSPVDYGFTGGIS